MMIGEYSATDLCRILRVNQSQLRACLHAALLPKSRAAAACSYTFHDLVMLRTTKGLSEAGVPVSRIRKVLDALQRQLGEGQTMTSLKIYASGKRVVVWDGASRWQPDSGQFLLNFDTSQMGAGTALTPAARGSRVMPTQAAQACFNRAMDLEEHAPEAARQWYQEALRLHPAFVDAHLHLGLLHHHAGRLVHAEACYHQVLHYAPQSARAHFHLAVVLEDQRKKRAAIAAYKEALTYEPKFLEAHCKLAHLYETLGRTRDAIRHYAAAKRLQS